MTTIDYVIIASELKYLKQLVKVKYVIACSIDLLIEWLELCFLALVDTKIVVQSISQRTHARIVSLKFICMF